MVINWLDFIWYELTLKGISEQTLLQGHLLVELSLARLFNSHWHKCPTVIIIIIIIIIIKKKLYSNKWIRGGFTKSHKNLLTNYIHWHDCSTVTGTIIQQWLEQLFNSRGQDFFFLCWQNSSTVKITVEELCHLPGIRYMICSFCYKTI